MEDWENFTLKDAHDFMCKIYITEREEKRMQRTIKEEVNKLLDGKTLGEKIHLMNLIIEDHKSEFEVVAKEWDEYHEKNEERLEFLNILESVGVDNWVGYDHAVAIFNGEEE